MIFTRTEVHIPGECSITKAIVTIYPPTSLPGFITLNLEEVTVYLSDPDIHLEQLIAVLQEAKEKWNRSKEGVGREATLDLAGMSANGGERIGQVQRLDSSLLFPYQY